MRMILMTGCIVLLAAQAASARDNRPGPESGSVSCKCQCKLERGDTMIIEARFVRGEGAWKGTRAQCKAFSNSQCNMRVEGETYGNGKLDNCDTVVHRLPSGRLPGLETAPRTGKAAPATGSSDTDPNAEIQLKFRRKVD